MGEPELPRDLKRVAASVMARATNTDIRERLEAGKIIAATAKVFDVDEETLRAPGRTSNQTSFARHVAMLLIRRHTLLTLDAIGLELGGRDHTTVFHGLERVRSAEKSDPEIATLMAGILDVAKAMKTHPWRRSAG